MGIDNERPKGRKLSEGVFISSGTSEQMKYAYPVGDKLVRPEVPIQVTVDGSKELSEDDVAKIENAVEKMENDSFA